MVTWDDFDKIWARTSPLTPYEFSDPNYSQGWNFVGSTPPARQMWDSIQKKNDEKFKYLRDNFGTPNIVTSSSQMTDTDKVYVYMGSEAGWNSGHWYYYDEGTSSWADGGVYNSVAFVTDPTLSIAGQPADAKAVGDALALKADIAGCTFTGNVSVNADFSVTGDASIGTDLSVAGTSTLIGNINAGADINAVGDVSCANLTTSADASVGGDLSVTGDSTLADTTVNDLVVNNDLSVAGDSSLTNFSVSGTTTLAGTSTALTPSAGDNSTKIATTEYVQTEIKPIETDVTINDKRIENIEKLLQGNLYDYQTDSTSGYTKSVPSGAMPYAGIEKIGGKTVVWNQLCKNVSGGNEWAVIIGHASISVADNVRTVTVTSSSALVRLYGYISNNYALTGHKFYIKCDIKFNNTLPNNDVSIGVGGYVSVSASITTLNTWTKISGIFTKGASGAETIMLDVPTANFSANDTYDFRDVVLYDLTLMFGAGNEPSTVEEFQQMFPADYYAYNAGTLLSAGVTEVESVGRNLLNPTWLINGTYTSNGTSGPASDRISIGSNYLAVEPNQTYTFSVGNGLLVHEIYQFDKYKNFISPYSTIGQPSTNFTVGSNTYYIRFSFRKSNNSNLEISEVVNPLCAKGSNITYAPYIGTIAVYPIPTAIRNLEGYGCSCLDLYNYIDFERKVYVQNVGIIDMGTLDFSVYSSPSGHIFRTSTSSIPNIKLPQSNSHNVNVVNPKYKVKAYGPINNTDDGYMAVSDEATNRTVFINHAFSDVDSFTSAMSGTYMVYYLDTPIETDISAYLTDDNLLEVESGGTLTFPNSNGIDYQIPVPSEEEYMIDLQEAINNG